MTATEVIDYHEHLAEQMIAEVRSWPDQEKPGHWQVDKLIEMANRASEPSMLVTLLAVAAAEAQTLADSLRTGGDE
jgi:hypothetical protein